jgi:putative metalloprotease
MKKIVLGIITLFVISGCSALKIVDSNAALNAGAAAVQALTISDAQIAELCTEYMAQTDKENTIAPASSEYAQRLNRIMGKFNNIKDLNLNYKVYQSSTINAFASGDGSVRVYSGLMDVMNDDELFAVIGHELGHLINKDVRDSYRTAYLVVAARYGLAAVNTTAGAISTGFLGDLGQQLASAAYSRKQETEADETAFQFCVANGVDPYAMYHALNVLLKIGGSTGAQGAVTQAFSDHPDTQKRANHIKELAEAAGYKMTTTGSANNITTTSNKGKVTTGNKTTTSGNNNSGTTGKGKTVIKKGGNN